MFAAASAGIMADVAGVVLAGGRSSRMGKNKALLEYQGLPLVEYMERLLHQAGVDDVYISGDLPGYACIHDTVRHDGPAHAMQDMLARYAQHHHRLLFIPVDMPRMHADLLKRLLSEQGDVYYEGYPLPVCLSTGTVAGDGRSVRDLLTARNARSIALPVSFEESMSNINTPQDWEMIAS